MLVPDDLPQEASCLDAYSSKDRPLWIYREQQSQEQQSRQPVSAGPIQAPKVAEF